MKEVIKLSDRITVLRHGKVKATRNRGETNPSELARLMMGESTIQTPEIKTKASQFTSDQSQNTTIVRLKTLGCVMNLVTGCSKISTWKFVQDK